MGCGYMASETPLIDFLATKKTEIFQRVNRGAVCLHMLSKKFFIGKVLMAAFVLAMCPEVVSITVIIEKRLIAAFELAIFGYGALHVVKMKLMLIEAKRRQKVPCTALEITMITNAITLVLGMVKRAVFNFV